MGILDWFSGFSGKKKTKPTSARAAGSADPTTAGAADHASAGPAGLATAESADQAPPASADLATASSADSPGSDVSRTLDVTGDWLSQVWKQKPVKVFAEVDAAMTFLSQAELPYLWDDEPKYIENLKSKPDPQRELRVSWIAAYLNHPAPGVVGRTLREHVTPDLLESWMVAGWLPFLMIHPWSDVREVAAKKVWDCRTDSTLRSIFGVFSGKYPGLASGAEKFAAEGRFQEERQEIVNSLREHCPAERKDFFEKLVHDTFGPSLAELDAPKSTGEVRFKEKDVKVRMGMTQTYEVHAAESKADALAFLEKRTISEANYYVIVETPEGNWGKDKMGLFEE